MKQEEGKTGRFRDCSGSVIGACIEVHRHLGPGLLESACERCLRHELDELSLPYERQKPVRVRYKGIELDQGYRLDLVVAGEVLIEIKAVETLLRVHEAQVITYLKLSGLSVGLLVNFHAATIRQGLRRFTNKNVLPFFPSSCDPQPR